MSRRGSSGKREQPMGSHRVVVLGTFELGRNRSPRTFRQGLTHTLGQPLQVQIGVFIRVGPICRASIHSSGRVPGNLDPNLYHIPLWYTREKPSPLEKERQKLDQAHPRTMDSIERSLSPGDDCADVLIWDTEMIACLPEPPNRRLIVRGETRRIRQGRVRLALVGGRPSSNQTLLYAVPLQAIYLDHCG
jgi:hypothetical protein